MDFLVFSITVLFRYILLFISVSTFVSLVIMLLKKKSGNKKKTAIIIIISLIVPYIFFYHGTYRNNRLNITDENIESIVLSLEKLDYNPQDDRETVCLINNGYYDTHEYKGVYENIIDGVYIAVEKYEGAPTRRGIFELHSGVVLNERFIENGFNQRYDRRIKISNKDDYTWITSALVANTLGDPLLDCGYFYLGEYYGYFDIQTKTNIYSVKYTYETKCKFLNNFLCVRPKKLTAEKLLDIFEGKPNKYYIDFS